LKTKGIQCEYIYSGSENQESIAIKWNGNKLRVLVSTTLGLVGNESSRTQLVCIVGLLYNLPSIVQSLGRIRPIQRSNVSQCRIFTNTNNQSRIQIDKNDSTTAMNELIGSGILSSDHQKKYKRSMTCTAVNKWLFEDQGCRYVSLAARLGYTQVPCNLCDACTETNVAMLGDSKREEIQLRERERENGIRLLSRLKQKCICCNKTDCDGTCVAMKQNPRVCLRCLGNHRVTKCTFDYVSILNQKACYGCYVYNYSQGTRHNIQDCSRKGGIQERLRGLIHYDYLKKKNRTKNNSDFLYHLSGIYSNEESFFKFLDRYKDFK